MIGEYRDGLWGPLPADLVNLWLEVLSSEQHVTDGICDEVFAGTLFPLQRKAEMRRMRDAVPTATQCVMDIGSDKGGGVYHWCEWFPSLRKMIVVEPRGTPYSDLFEQRFPKVEFLWLPKPSLQAANVEAVSDFLGEDRLDVLFIDGDKVATGRDFTTYSTFVREGGVALIHDINDDGHPQDAFGNLRNSYKSDTIIDLSELPLQHEPTTPYETWCQFWHDRSAGVGVLYL